MKRFSEQFYKKAEPVKLTAAERGDLKERLLAYMEYHPLPAVPSTSQPHQEAILADPFSWVSIPYRAIFSVAVPVAVLLLVVVPFAAERAVPGDALYAVKQANEELRSTLIFDSYQKVEWETERINRRIAEARLLASEGKLTEKVEAEVALAVKTHTENAKREIEVLRAEDADEAQIAAIAFDTTLEVQSASLKEQTEYDSAVVLGEANEEDSHVSLIADAIDASLHASVEQEPLELPSYPKLMARVEMNTTRVYELRQGLVTKVSAEQLNEVDRRIEDVSRTVQAAIELSSASGTAAQEQLVDVLQRTQKLIVYMTELEVAETINIEDIVPVVLTEQEEAEQRSGLTEELEQKADKIEATLGQIKDEMVVAKTEYSLQEIARLSNLMASSAILYAEFKTIASDAHALADDTLKLIEQTGVLQEEPDTASEFPEAHASGTDEFPATETDPAATSEHEGDAEVIPHATPTDDVLSIE